MTLISDLTYKDESQPMYIFAIEIYTHSENPCRPSFPAVDVSLRPLHPPTLPRGHTGSYGLSEPGRRLVVGVGTDLSLDTQAPHLPFYG